jgi:superfamily II DNA or RNA helicase
VFYTDDTKFIVHPRVHEYDITPEIGKIYNRAVRGIGLGTVVYQIRYWDYTKQRELEIGREHTEGVWNETQTQTILAPDVKAGQLICVNGNICQVQFVKTVEAKADFFKRIIELQRILLEVEQKFGALLNIVRDKGSLIYCNFLESADYVVERLKRELPSRRVVKLTGGTNKKYLAMTVKSLQSDDVAVITRAASQSLDFYFQQVVLYEQITTPGLLEQFIGRCMRNDADFDQLDVIFLCCRRTIEEYLYSRCRAETNQSPGALMQNKLPAVQGYEGIENWDFRQLKDNLLWQPWQKAVEQSA